MEFWNTSIRERILADLCSAFKNAPQRFFTEHDIHSWLYWVAQGELNRQSASIITTRDGYKTSLLHHEYPTPFRCSMSGYGFAPANEEKRTPKGGKYKRGHYDLVLLNPEFVSTNDLVVVMGKNFSAYKAVMGQIKTSPILWVCEVIYFPRIARIPENAIKIIEQDSLKVKETLGHRLEKGIPFCKSGSVLVFTGFTSDEDAPLGENIQELEDELGLSITYTTAL